MFINAQIQGLSGVTYSRRFFCLFCFLASFLEKCHTDLANFLRPRDYLGVPIAQGKTV